MSATVLFLPSPSASGSWGSTIRLASIAEECRRYGDRVVFHVPTPADEQLRLRGMEVAAFAGITPTDLSSGPVNSFYDVCKILGFGEPASWERMLRAEAILIAEVKPDVIVANMRPTAPLSAARTGVPLVSCAWPGADPRQQATGEHEYDELARRMAARWSDLELSSMAELICWRGERQLALSFPAFDPEFADVPDVVYTGHMRDTWQYPDQLPAVPKRLVVVYASSSPWGVPRIVDALDEAARRAGATVWCVLRSDTPERLYSDHCKLFRFLPMDDILTQASALVFHGGRGTAIAALHYGVPALAVPGRHYERRRNADRLEEIGIGVTGDLVDLLPSRLSTHFDRLLDNSLMRDAASAAQAEAAKYRGVAVAADAVHDLVG